MDIRVLGAHNCESRDSRLISLLIDDVLVIDAGCLTSTLSLEAQQKIKAVLITHQHYDHIRDIPAIAMNFALQGKSINIYSTHAVYDALSTYLLNGKLYPKFLELPENKPVIKFTLIEPYRVEQIESYTILAVLVNHTDPTVGYQVTSPAGKTVLYTADTGPGLVDCWKRVSPQLLVTEVTVPNRYEGFAKEAGHLTPNMLKQELISFRELKGYLPPAVVVHMNPGLEKEIEAEVAAVATTLNTEINLAYEGMRLKL